MTREVSRREFCRLSAALGILGPAGIPFALQLAAINGAAAQSAPDYKALVCIFLFGGNDGNNTVLATDNDSWGRYFATRNMGADPIALMPVGTPPAALGSTSQFVPGRTVTRATPEFWGGVLPVVPKTANPIPAGTNATVRTFALHPMLAPLVPIFNARRLSILANVGPLITPTTKAQYVANSVPVPFNLFSHNDQQSVWQAGKIQGAQRGWGGLMADIVNSMNGANAIFTAVSVAGNAVFLAGQTNSQYQMSTGNTPAISITGANAATMFGSNLAPARFQSIIRDTTGTSLFMRDDATIVARSMDSATSLNSAFAQAAATAVAAPPTYTNPITGATETNSLAVQMFAVAKMIASNVTLGMHRQVFFVSLGGFDTHDLQNPQQPNLLAKVAAALSYFDGALANMNGVDMRNSVTTFTASDFSRTFTTNGDGTDHSWGSHHFILGPALAGGDIYGRYPTLGVDAGAFSNPSMVRNHIIPTASVDQYGATLGRWFGVSEANLDLIFPNLRNYSTRGVA